MAPSLNGLPSELLCYILEAANDLADLFSLILTTPLLAAVWKANKSRIFPRVLARSVDCFEVAERLDDIFTAGTSPSLLNDACFNCEDVMRRYKRILAGSRCIDALYAKFLRDWVKDIAFQGVRRREREIQSVIDCATAQERQPSKLALYHLWRLVRISAFSLQPGTRRRKGHHNITLPSRLCDIDQPYLLAVFEILVWTQRYGPRNPVNKLLNWAWKIYGPTDKLRIKQPKRWILCSESLWASRIFRRSRRRLWRKLRLNLVEPIYLDMNCESRQFLLEASKALRAS